MPQSSFHVWWDDLPREPVVACAAMLTIVTPPDDDELFFWALQVTIADGRGRRLGGCHTGLQHNPRFRASNSGAINWGGYIDGTNSVLRGTDPTLPFFQGDPNTAGFAWKAGVPYWFRVYRGSRGWAADVTDTRSGVTTLIREVFCDGDRLVSPLVWAEVFAPCEHSPTTARWSDLTVQTADGQTHSPGSVRFTFPGACQNTAIVPVERGYELRTSVPRSPG
jgi:hypothetical protein